MRASLKYIFLVLSLTVSSNGFNSFKLKSIAGRQYVKPLNVATEMKDPKGTKIIAPQFEGSCENTGITLTRYMIEAVAANPQIRELESVRYYYCIYIV